MGDRRRSLDEAIQRFADGHFHALPLEPHPALVIRPMPVVPYRRRGEISDGQGEMQRPDGFGQRAEPENSGKEAGEHIRAEMSAAPNHLRLHGGVHQARVEDPPRRAFVLEPALQSSAGGSRTQAALIRAFDCFEQLQAWTVEALIMVGLRRCVTGGGELTGAGAAGGLGIC